MKRPQKRGRTLVTDKLITLSTNETEVLAVLAHELGHIAHQHSLRQILQQSGIAITIAMIGGDTSVLSDIVFTLPIVFTQLSYSRKFELEADNYALNFLHQRDLSTQALDHMLIKLHRSHRLCRELNSAETSSSDSVINTPVDGDKNAEKNGSAIENETPCESILPNWSRYLSTHPHADERIEALSRARDALPHQ